MRPDIVILDGYTLNPGDLDWSAFEQLGKVTVYDRTAKDEIVKRIGNASIVITNKTPIDSATLGACPTITYIGVLATGYDVVDIKEAKRRGIVVTNIPTYGTTAVAQYVFALLLELCHHVGDHAKAVRQGRWTSCPDFCFWDYPLVELAGKTMGIIGLGRIGKATASIAQAFGMSVLAFDEYRHPEWESDTLHYADIDTLLSRSDVISLHCPLTDATRGIINSTTIAKMKDGVFLINTARGQLIKEEDLAQALAGGKVGGAAVDVLSEEPPKSTNALLQAPNCIVTPHIAWAPKESRKRLMDIAVENLASFLAGAAKNRV